MNKTKKLIHPWQKEPIILEKKISNLKPNVTIVMPVFNQEKIIDDILFQTCLSMGNFFKIIIIDDGSDDNSYKKILNFLKFKSSEFSLLCSYVVIKNELPIYETACDNQGFRMADTEFIIEIQSDIILKEKNFDVKMIKILNNHNIGTVSGRHLHPFALIDGHMSWLKYPLNKLRYLANPNYQCVGLIGNRIFSGVPVNTLNNFFCIGETNARGPWLLRKSDLITLGYLDEENFFLGNDDHDYNRRIYKYLNKKAAYININLQSTFETGSTRKTRVGVNLEIYNYLREKKRGSNEFNIFLKNYKPYCKTEYVPI
jgi:glycosyltransferase involved in cell wall biosynthesis